MDTSSEDFLLPFSHILIIEDDKILNQLIQKTLKREGYEVLSANNTGTAHQLIKEFPKCLLLLDYVLPDKQASEFITELEENNILCPFIICTGHGDEKLAVKMMKLGAYDYIVKDSSFLEVLVTVIKKTERQLRTELKLKKAQEEIKRSEEKYRNLVETTSDIIWETNTDGKFTYINPRIENILGYTPEEIIGHSPFDFMPDEEAKKIKIISDEIVSSKVPYYNLENINLHKDGHSVIFETSGVPVLDSKNNLKGFRGVDRDITDRKLAEVALQNSNLKFKSLTDNITGYVAYVDANTLKYEFVNPAFEKSFGISRNKIIGSHIKKVIGDANYQFALKYIEEVKKGKTVSYENSFNTMEGRRWLQVNYSPVFNAMGSVDFIVVLCNDITERRQAEDALHESEESYCMLFDSISDALMISELTGDEKSTRFIKVNNIACERLGYTQQELLSKTTNEITSDRMKPAIASLMKDIVHKENSLFESEHVTKDGKIIPVEVSTRISKINNKIVFHSVARDITERKRAEEEVTKSEEKFRKAFITSPDAININRLDDGMYITINKGFTQIMGYSEEDVYGKTSIELNIWKNPDDRKKLVQELKKKASVENLEAEFISKNGDIRYGLTSAALIELNGKPHILSITRDITERSIIQNSLKESEERYRQLVDNTDTGIVVIDIKGYVITANEPYVHMIGASHIDDLIGHSVIEWTAAEETGNNAKAVALCAQQGFIQDFETVYIHKDGRNIHVLLNATVKENAKGEKQIISFCRNITERKLVENELFVNEAKLRAIYMAIPVPTYTWQSVDGNFVLVSFNDAAIKISKGNINKLVGIKASEMYRDNPEIIKVMNQCFHDKNAIEQEMDYTLYTTGEAKHLNVKYAFVPPDQILVHTEDIPAQKRAETEVIENKEQLDLALRSAGMGVWNWDIVNDKRFFDQQVCTILGIDISTFRGTADEFFKIVHPDDIEIIKQHHLNTLNNDALYNPEYRVILPDKSVRHIASRGKLIRDTTGNPLKINGILWDITNRKKAEQALADNEEKYRNIFSNIQDCYYETSLDGTVLEVSPSISNISQYTREELIGKNMSSFYQDTSLRTKLVNELKEIGYVNDFGITLIDKNKRKVRCSVTTKIIFDAENNPQRIVGSMRNIEARLKAEEELNKSREKYKELYEASNDILYTMDFKGNFTSISPSAEKILGYKLDELTQFNMSNYMTKASAKTAFDNITAKLKGRKTSTNYEVDFLNKDGSYTTLEINSMIRYQNRKPYEVSGIARDITERKKLSNELHRSLDVQNVLNTILQLSMDEVSLQKVLDNTLELLVNIPWLVFDKKAAIFITNPDGNLYMASYFGLSPEIVTACARIPQGKCICGKVFESKTAIFMQKIDHDHDISYNGMHDHGHYCVPILYGDLILGVINTYVKSDHEYFESEMNFLKAVADTLAGIIARKNAEEELQVTLNQLEEKIKYRSAELIRSEEIYRTTVDTFNDWVYVVDRNLNLVSINKALENFFRSNGIQNIYVGKNIRETFKFLGENEFKIISSVFDKGVEISHESEYIVFDKTFYTERIISPVKQNNEVVRVVITVHDYTRLKQVEEDMRHTLEKEKELNMLKSRFISTVSHEFRTPLAGILSSIQLLKRYGQKWDDEKKEKTYQQIVDAVHHTKSLLDDVSLIDKQQNQAFSFKPSYIDLQLLVRQIIDDNTLFYNTDCKVLLTYNIAEPTVYLDPTMTRHIVTNLVSNAIKYSGDGKEVNITISDHGNKEIEFIIADNGIGIPEADQKHLFVAFHRASNVEGIQGTGFGMSVVKRFVELHKGSISFESALGVGTTVKVILPANPEM